MNLSGWILGSSPLIFGGIIAIRQWAKSRDWRDSTLTAFLITSALLVLSTEFFGHLHLLTRTHIIIFWILLVTIAALMAFFDRSYLPNMKAERGHQKSPLHFFFLGICLTFALGTLFIAIIYPPNNWDSMTYHMPRVMHWIQNRSLTHYPTHYSPQVFMSPGAEFFILHFQLLAGDDRLANLVQWACYILGAITVSLITRELGRGHITQWLSGFLFMTLPMAILQASSTQTDLVATLWVLASFYFCLRIEIRAFSSQEIVKLSVAVALAILTKPTVIFFLTPILAYLAFQGLAKNKRAFCIGGLSILISMTLINGAFFARNIQSFGGPLSAPDDYLRHKTMQRHGWKESISNITRNSIMHIDITRHLTFNRVATLQLPPLAAAFSKRVHRFLHIDPDDQDLTIGKFCVPGYSINENTSGNPLHFFLILFSLISLCFFKRWAKELFTLAIVTTGYILFCSMIKWEIFNVRLHLIPFALLIPVTAAVLVHGWKIHNLKLLFISSIITITSLPFLFFNPIRTFTPSKEHPKEERLKYYFNDRKWLEQPSRLTANSVAKIQCEQIGLWLENDHYEYPFWVLLQSKKSDIEIRHVLVKNQTLRASNKKSYEAYQPCVIIFFEKDDSKVVKNFTYGQNVYREHMRFLPYTVYLKDSSPSEDL